jgi:hypothetical protein
VYCRITVLEYQLPKTNCAALKLVFDQHQLRLYTPFHIWYSINKQSLSLKETVEWKFMKSQKDFKNKRSSSYVVFIVYTSEDKIKWQLVLHISICLAADILKMD